MLSDEVYNTLVYDDAEAVSIATFLGMRERTVVINSLFKAYAMCGWQIGYALEHRELTEGIRDSFAQRRKVALKCLR